MRDSRSCFQSAGCPACASQLCLFLSNLIIIIIISSASSSNMSGSGDAHHWLAPESKLERPVRANYFSGERASSARGADSESPVAALTSVCLGPFKPGPSGRQAMQLIEVTMGHLGPARRLLLASVGRAGSQPDTGRR